MVDIKEAKEATDAGGKPAEKKPDQGTKKPGPPWGKKAQQKPTRPAPSANNSGFKGGIKSIEEDIFIYGKGMTAKWLKSKEKLLAYIGNRFTMNEAKSLENGSISIVGFNKRDDIKDENDFKALSFTEKELYKLDLKKYSEAEGSVRKNLATCFSIIWNQMDRSLKNQVEKDTRYLQAYKDLDAPLLYTIMSDICNASSTVDHFESRHVEMMYNLLMCSGKNLTLAEYYELFNHRVKAAKTAGVDFMSTGIREDLIAKAITRLKGDQALVKDYIQKNLSGDLQKSKDRILGIIFIKRAGPAYDHCRKELNNDFVKGNDNFPTTVDEAYAILQNYEAITPAQHKGQAESNASSKSRTGLSFQQNTDFR